MPNIALDAVFPASHPYGAYLFPFFLEKEYRKELIRDIWSAAKDQRSLDAVDSVLKSAGENGLKGVWRVFVRRNWNQPPLDLYRTWGGSTKGGLTEGAVTVGTIPTGKNVITKLTLGSGEQEKVLPLGLMLEHLSAQYHHFALTDSKVRSVTFFTPVFTPPSDAVTVGVVTKIKGASGKYDDWTREAKKTFCRDVQGENLDELVIMFGNSDLTKLLSTKNARLVITNSCAAVQSVTIKPANVIGAATSKGTVTLDRSAPDGGVIVLLKSDNNLVATVDKQVIVGKGTTNADFTIRTTPVPNDTHPFISASRSEASGVGSTRRSQISVRQPHLKSIVIPGILTSKQVFTGTVTLDGKAPQGGFVVRLRPQAPGSYLTHPGTVRVEPGENTADFKGKVGLLPSQRSGEIVAEGGGGVISAKTKLKP